MTQTQQEIDNRMTEKQNNQGIALTSVKVQASTCFKCCSGTLKDFWKKKTVSTNFNKLKQYCKEEWDRMSSQWRERLAESYRGCISVFGVYTCTLPMVCYAKTRQSTANHVRVVSNAWILSHSMLTACSHGHCQKVCTPKNKAFPIVCLGLWSGPQFPSKLVIETVNLSGNCFPVDNWTYFYLLVAVRRKAMLSLNVTPICWKDIIPCGSTKEQLLLIDN